jgi:hypothetical protein
MSKDEEMLIGLSSLGEWLDSQRSVLIGRMVAELRRIGKRERNVPLDQLEAWLAPMVEAFCHSLVEEDPGPLALSIQKIVRQDTWLSHHNIQQIAGAMRSVLLEAIDEACCGSPQRWQVCTRKIEDMMHLMRITMTDMYTGAREEVFANQQKELLAAYQQVKQRADERGALSGVNLKKRTAQLQAAAEVSRAISSMLDLDELLPQVVELICACFELYYVGIFLVDDVGKWAILRAGSGEAGCRMLEAGHKLEVGGLR